ncbi:hypothetical protein EJD97_004098 [Solanum chilense]|uniref:Uncharacterized protein n=1 Tax=Solanum chilense TaxID=4083 RepID=A0A6N2BSB0_SOLCI|nr:hypothetical protein EJD97_004098 [Solanum chilense]
MAAQSASSDEAGSSDSTPGSPTGVPPWLPTIPTGGVSTIDRQASPPNRSHLSMSEYAAYRSTSPCQPSAGICMARVPLEHVRVRGIQVDISLPAILRCLYGEDVDTTKTPLTAEFDYLWKIVKDGRFLCESSLRETTKRWMAQHLSIDREAIDWVMEPKGAMRKANLTFTAKSAVCPSGTLISSRLRRAMLISASSGMRLMTHARTAMQATSAPTKTTSVESIPGSSTAPSSSRSAPSPALVPLARVQKLDAQMTILLHHIQPWMHRSITEAEERLERKMAQCTERKIAEAAVEGLREDLDMILEARVPKSEAPSAELAEDRRRGREDDEARARKKERREMEAARRASIADEETRKIRVVESAVGASSSRDVEIAGGTTDSVVADEDTTEGVQTI